MMCGDNDFKIAQSLERIANALEKLEKTLEEIQRNGL